MVNIRNWFPREIAPNDGRSVDVVSGYFATNPSDVEIQVNIAARTLRKIDFDTIVCIGVSGLIFASPLAIRMKKHLLVVRKTEETSHGSFHAEGYLGRRWIFVDDFISSGRSFMNANAAIEKICKGEWCIWDNESWPDLRWDTHCVGIYTYRVDRNPGFHPAEDEPYGDGPSHSTIKWKEVR